MKIIGIIATKNRNELLCNAIKSALSQTRKLEELIIVSDSDEECLDKDKKLCENICTFLKNQYTRNYAGNLNTAIDYIVLKYIINLKENPNNIYVAFLDDDDIWKSSYIEKCCNILYKNPDFVVAGLNYHTDEKIIKLDIPQHFDETSFLSKNPHVQGSNTFIKFSVLLKAGCFDEALNSTTDRDLFTRVLMLKPSYEIINEYLVDVDAHNDRQRLTNNKDGKLKSLSYFYSKYYGLMSNELKIKFFERAKMLADINENVIDQNLTKESLKEAIVWNNKKFDGHVIFGFITSDDELGIRLFDSLMNLKEINKSVVVLCNIEKPSRIYFEKANKLDAKIYDLNQAKTMGKRLESLSFAKDNLNKPGKIKDIAVSRTILHELLKINSNDEDVLWILDDDMEFKYLIRENSKFIKKDLPVSEVLAKYQGKADVVIGSYSEDAPLPTLSTLRTSLLDYVYKIKIHKESLYRTDIYENRDYYYDLSDNHIGLETPLFTKSNSLEEVFSGKATSRKLYVKDLSEFEPYCRGGNTIIYNKKVLDIPNVSPKFGDQIARRSDYFWVEQAKDANYKVIGSSFATLHSKLPIPFDLNKEADKLLKDLLGSSFTKTVELKKNNREDFYNEFKYQYESRLTRIVVSFYRILGLLHVIDKDSYNGFNEEFINRFIYKAKYYLYEPTVRSAYDVIRNITSKYLMTNETNKIMAKLGDNFKVIGSGLEGVVVEDNNSFIYKIFYNDEYLDCLKECTLNFDKCDQLEKIEYLDICGYNAIKYKQCGNITKYEGGHTKELVSLIRFLKDNNLVISNIKKDNFILLDGKLKYIDYGRSFAKYTIEKYNRMVKRAYEMLKYSNLSLNEFTEIIEKDYMNCDKEILFGINNFKKLLQHREKEVIHDYIIVDKIKEYKPKTILDYGAGKCKIANSLVNDYKCYVFDIDLKTLNDRASKEVIKVEEIDNFKDKVDLVISNLVLCNVNEEWDNKILNNVSRILKKNGHAIISVCNPFFDSIDNTELRTKGYDGDYTQNKFYTKLSLYGPKDDYHRPFKYYENLFKRNGFEIKEIIESDGVNVDTLNPISEHLIFDVVNIGSTILEDCSLMIKTCPMDYEIVIPCINQIINNLENGFKFKEIIVSVDLSNEERTRIYSNDDEKILLEKLNYLKTNGSIDRIVTSLNHESYIKWFGIDSKYDHSENGQQILATINGFDNIKTRYVFQTDIDILYKAKVAKFMESFNDFVQSNAVTATLGICRDESIETTSGKRVEVRSCFIDLEKLYAKLPLENFLNDEGKFILPWHRALDNNLLENESVRLGDKDIFFVHLPNYMKRDNFVSAYVLGNIPLEQMNKVDAVNIIKKWYPKAYRSMSIFSRGKNVGVEKLKRLIDSLKSQDDQDFDFIYFDDNSNMKEQEYLYSLSKYDTWCKIHMKLIQNVHSVDSLANFDYALKYIITNPYTIVVNIDGDDCLLRNDALALIRNAYKNGVDMTSGGCFRADKPNRRYAIESFKQSWLRNGDNIWLHPKTFRRYLFDYIGDFLIENGRYVDTHTDYAILLPIVEAARHPVEIKELIYYFEPSLENVEGLDQYNIIYKKETLNKLFEKAKRRFMKPVISVIGDAVINKTDEEYLLGEKLGKALVDAGYRVQTGGLGGIMEAVLKGAKSSLKYEFGDTIAILPGTDPDEANEYADIKIATGLDNMRARQVVDAYAVIAIGGGAGTLAEIATAWSMYKLIIAWNGKGWSSKLVNKRIDARIRYKEIKDDRIYGFCMINEALEIINKLGCKYQKEYHGIKWRKK